jgi:GT2 family glycosyltransferase
LSDGEIAMIDNLPLVTIIVVNYNGKSYLKDNFTSLEKLKYPKGKLEVIFVDNGSKDGSVGYIKTNFPWVKVLQLDANYGFCRPNNEGAKIANGVYLIFLNNDTVVNKSWLQELVKGVKRQPNIVCCASKILYYDKKDLINAAGGKITQIGGGFYRGYGEHDCDKYSNFTYTGFGCGAGVLIDKNFFLRIGGFDEDYFASCEEHELGLRVWMYGYKVLYVPTAVMYHKESGTFGAKGSFQPKKVYLITRNRLYNLLKNFEPMNVLRGLVVGLIFDVYRSCSYLLSKNPDSVKSILNAYVDVSKNLKKLFKKRTMVQSNRKLSDKELHQLGVVASLRDCIIEEMRLSNVLQDPFYKN